MELSIDRILEHMGNPRFGLPEPLFLMISRMTPLVNVDLLIKDEQQQTLLTWRDDQFYGPGWHIPGGIIRFKEPALARVARVAELELGSTVEADPEPLVVREIMSDSRDERGHFISLLYNCRLTAGLDFSRRAGDTPLVGQWKWHRFCPLDLIDQHRCYQNLF